jgi:hypothetical protein
VTAAWSSPASSIPPTASLRRGCHVTQRRRYRARDLTNVATLLYCQTEPVIESSKNVSFGCFAFAYLPLASQFVAAKLSPWDNRWSEVYDFTPNASGSKNFSLLEPSAEDAFPVKPLSAVGEWTWSVPPTSFALPSLHPSRVAGATRRRRSNWHVPLCPRLSDSARCRRAATRQVLASPPLTARASHATCHSHASAVILASGGGKELCLELIQAVSAQRCVLVQACAARLDRSKAQQLQASIGACAAHVTLSDGEMVVAAQLCGGSTLAQALQDAAERYGGAGSGIVIVDAAAATAAAHLFFSQWREHSGHAVTK